jgi:ribosomal protein S18 acetylase RimI-like enzyme
MATVAFTNPEPRIVPLAETDPSSLDPLFKEQCDEWRRMLNWDYTAPSRSIRDVLTDGDLSGYVVFIGGQAAGFCFYVIEGSRVSIGDIYVSKSFRGLGADRQMAAALLEEIDQLSKVRRIESQCVSLHNDGADALFKSEGFAHYDRYYMAIRPDSTNTKASSAMTGVLIRSWEEDDFDDAARVIKDSYRGSPDRRINCQYASDEGCAELLSILTGHVWCGDFLPEVSRVAVNADTGNRIAVLIASRIAARSGHLSQISVRPAFQELGIGRRMILSSLEAFSHRGFEAVSLAVTASNTRAVHLYESCGFQTIHTFPVFYRERKGRRAGD